tara:strand:+ start:8706 stop:9269 length:564 start_codon:yes stop_codon:yes gene_type:complete
MINIIGGEFRGKKIEIPSAKVRPTSAKKREAIFSILESYAIKKNFNLYKNKCFIDLFAGSGSMGIEAISRGSFHSYFYEKERKVCEIISKNLHHINKKKYEIRCLNILSLKKISIDFPLSAIFIDPPYKFEYFYETLSIIINSNILKQNSIIVLESNKENKFKVPHKLKELNEKIYGKTKIIFYSLA